MKNARWKQLINKHTIHGANVLSSTGVSSDYLDGIGMLLAEPDLWCKYYEERLQPNLWPVATGASGAVILGILGRGTLWSSKGYGLEWYGWDDLKLSGPVALVDDCRFTGTTLSDLRRACASWGMDVVREIVAYPYTHVHLQKEGPPLDDPSLAIQL